MSRVHFHGGSPPEQPAAPVADWQGQSIRSEFADALQLVAKRRAAKRFEEEDRVAENVRRRADAIQESLAGLFEGLESKPEPAPDADKPSADDLEAQMRAYQQDNF